MDTSQPAAAPTETASGPAATAAKETCCACTCTHLVLRIVLAVVTGVFVVATLGVGSFGLFSLIDAQSTTVSTVGQYYRFAAGVTTVLVIHDGIIPLLLIFPLISLCCWRNNRPIETESVFQLVNAILLSIISLCIFGSVSMFILVLTVSYPDVYFMIVPTCIMVAGSTFYLIFVIVVTISQWVWFGLLVAKKMKKEKGGVDVDIGMQEKSEEPSTHQQDRAASGGLIVEEPLEVVEIPNVPPTNPDNMMMMMMMPGEEGRAGAATGAGHQSMIDQGSMKPSSEPSAPEFSAPDPSLPPLDYHDGMFNQPNYAIDAPTSCPHCGHELKPNAKFCGGCGQSMVEKEPTTFKCDRCGAEIDRGERFCPECGTACDAY